MSRAEGKTFHLYRVSHLLVGLGWVDFHLCFQPLLPNSYQPRQNWADGDTHKTQVNRTESTSRWDTLYK